jgi:signal transduction histidine kinase
MRTLTLRIYLTLVAVLLLFAFGSTWLFQRQLEHERNDAQTLVGERIAAWGDLIERSLPPATAPVAAQRDAVLEWSDRLRLPLALDSREGERIAESASFDHVRRGGGRQFAVPLDDGRTLWVARRPALLRSEGAQARRPGASPPAPWPLGPSAMPRGLGLVLVLVLLFVAVAAAAWPVVRRLTRRLDALKRGVEQFGQGQLSHRVDATGRDEVAAVASSFNQAAERIEQLVRSHQSLLANASHELRSPLARMKMAVSMLDEAQSPEQRARLKREIDTNVRELDALVEEVLLASRLDANRDALERETVDLLALAAEEAARVEAQVQGVPASVTGSERLLRRALRNLLENARRYGGGEIEVRVSAMSGQVGVQVCDRGPGVPPAQRERIFEPFYRMPGHAEQAGGVGLGLSLVKQIAEKHQGSVRCTERDGGGSCFEIVLPAG